jgi:hypothetical protein
MVLGEKVIDDLAVADLRVVPPSHKSRFYHDTGAL